MRYLEGQQFQNAWANYAKQALAEEGAPSLATGGMTQADWDYRVRWLPYVVLGIDGKC